MADHAGLPRGTRYYEPLNQIESHSLNLLATTDHFRLFLFPSP